MADPSVTAYKTVGIPDEPQSIESTNHMRTTLNQSKIVLTVGVVVLLPRSLVLHCSVLVEREVIHYRCDVLVPVERFQHLQTLVVRNFL